MMNQHDEPVDLAAFRAKREESQRRRKGRETRPGYAVNYGRVIPPPLNPDVPKMVKEVKDCYSTLIEWIAGFKDEIAELAGAGKLDAVEQWNLSEHYFGLQSAIEAALLDIPEADPGSRANDYFIDGLWNRRTVNRFADHAKYVYAVGNRDIAALQYRVAELAHTGRLNFAVHEHLQWDHCTQMWEDLYRGTLSALHDERTWDGAWDWYDNVYSDGRQVMVQARLKNWEDLDRKWPYNEGMSGDGPALEHPRGSMCQIFPVAANEGDSYWHPSVEIDLEDLIAQLGPAASEDRERRHQG